MKTRHLVEVVELVLAAVIAIWGGSFLLSQAEDLHVCETRLDLTERKYNARVSQDAWHMAGDVTTAYPLGWECARQEGGKWYCWKPVKP